MEIGAKESNFKTLAHLFSWPTHSRCFTRVYKSTKTIEKLSVLRVCVCVFFFYIMAFCRWLLGWFVWLCYVICCELFIVLNKFFFCEIVRKATYRRATFHCHVHRIFDLGGMDFVVVYLSVCDWLFEIWLFNQNWSQLTIRVYDADVCFVIACPKFQCFNVIALNLI